MPLVRISIEAEVDIEQITAHTTSTWGWRQADLYLAKLEDSFKLLAANTSMGRACDSLYTGLRRFEIGKHVIFYLAEPDGVLVVRVLHEGMLRTNYL